MFKEGLLEGKRILITGGGTGLGKEIAARYLQLGAELWLAARRHRSVYVSCLFSRWAAGVARLFTERPAPRTVPCA